MPNDRNENGNGKEPSLISLIVYGLLVVGFAFLAAPIIVAIGASGH